MAQCTYPLVSVLVSLAELVTCKTMEVKVADIVTTKEGRKFFILPAIPVCGRNRDAPQNEHDSLGRYVNRPFPSWGSRENMIRGEPVNLSHARARTCAPIYSEAENVCEVCVRLREKERKRERETGRISKENKTGLRERKSEYPSGQVKKTLQ